MADDPDLEQYEPAVVAAAPVAVPLGVAIPTLRTEGFENQAAAGDGDEDVCLAPRSREPSPTDEAPNATDAAADERPCHSSGHVTEDDEESEAPAPAEPLFVQGPFRVLALQRTGGSPGAGQPDMDDTDEPGFLAPVPSLAYGGVGPAVKPPKLLADDAPAARRTPTNTHACKWDGPSSGTESAGLEWHEALGPECPLWAQQLAASTVPESILRYSVGARSILRDWRVAFLVIRYGRRLPWVAVSDKAATEAVAGLSAIRLPATDEGKRRRVRGSVACVGVVAWLDEAVRLSDGPSSAADVSIATLAAALTRIWQRLVSPLVPTWVVAGCVLEWALTVFASSDAKRSDSLLAHRVSRDSARIFLFDTVDALATTRLQSELDAVAAACVHATASGGGFGEELAWLESLTTAPTPWSSADSRTAWSWGLPFPNALCTVSAVEDLPCAWVEYPTAWVAEAEATARGSSFRGCHSVVVELGRRRPSSASEAASEDQAASTASSRELGSGDGRDGPARVLLLEDDINVTAMCVTRGGIALQLRREADADAAVSATGTSSDVEALLRELEGGDPTTTEATEPDSGDPMAGLEAAMAIRIDAAVSEASAAARTAVAVVNDDALSATPGALTSARTSGPDGDAAWYHRVAPHGQRAKWCLEDLERGLPPDAPSIIEVAESQRCTHLVSSVLMRDRRTSAVPGAQPLDRTLRRTIARATESTAAAADQVGIVVRFVTDDADALVACSAARLLQLLADERPAARGMAVYATAGPGEAPEKLCTEYYDRGVDDASSDEDSPALSSSAAPSTSTALVAAADEPGRRETVTADLFLHPTTPILDHTIRRLALRTGGLPLVRRLMYLLRDAAATETAVGVAPSDIACDGSHVSIFIAPAPHCARPQAASPEAMGMVPLPRAQPVERTANRQATIQASIRSASPADAAGMLTTPPLGGWRAQPAPTNLPRKLRRNAAGIDIPPAAVNSNALPSKAPPVERTAFGHMRAASLRQRSSTPDFGMSSDLNAILDGVPLIPPSDQRPDAGGTTTDGQPNGPRAYAPPMQPPADVLGQHPRHPGATAEWAYLDALRKRAASTDPASAPLALAKLKGATRHMPDAPAGHPLSMPRLNETLHTQAAVGRGGRGARDPDLETAAPRSGSTSAASNAGPSQRLKFRSKR